MFLAASSWGRCCKAGTAAHYAMLPSGPRGFASSGITIVSIEAFVMLVLFTQTNFISSHYLFFPEGKWGERAKNNNKSLFLFIQEMRHSQGASAYISLA